MFDGVESDQNSKLQPFEKSCPDFERLSRPVVGRSLGGVVARYNQPVHKVISKLVTCVEQFDFGSKFFLFSSRVGSQANEESIHLRTSWYLVNVYLLYRYQAEHKGICFSDAIEWFWGSAPKPRKLINHLRVSGVDDIAKLLADIGDRYAVLDLMPYIIEPHGHVTRSKLESCDVSKSIRRKKKAGGVYYTPSDVADFMVYSTYAEGGQSGTWIDPACGTGVFIRSILRQAADSGTEGRLLEFFISNVYGIDKSILSIESCAFIVTLEILEAGGEALSPLQIWNSVHGNLYADDSLSLVAGTNSSLDLFENGQKPLSSVFPGLSEEAFDYCVMNPPYASVHISEHYRRQWDVFKLKSIGSKGDIHLAFIELMSVLLKCGGVGCAVLPLSVAANTSQSYRDIRSMLVGSGDIGGLFFDREPQSLFGEDIKTRSAIMLHRKTGRKGEIKTSRMIRWSGENRDKIFDISRLVQASSIDVIAMFPKLGSKQESDLYEHARRLECLSDVVLSRATYEELLGNRKKFINSVIISGTAYNYINAFFSGGISRASVSLSSSPLNVVSFPSRDLAYAAYAVISSKMSFWLWHVEGDGFHLTSQYIKRNPFLGMLRKKCNVDFLAVLGKQIWGRSFKNCVSSLNGGKTTYSFHDSLLSKLVTDIDIKILEEIGMGVEYEAVLSNFLLDVAFSDRALQLESLSV